MVLTTPLAEALRQVTPLALVSPPLAFDGTLKELFDTHIAPNLPSPDAVASIHRTLTRYCALDDPLLLLRYVRGETRGEVVRTPAGRYRPTDNSPAWLMHFLASNDVALPEAEHLEPLIAEWPCHMFELTRLRIRTVSHHGWHIAHLLPVKDRNTDPSSWSRAALVRRFIRNVHPCNYSYLPKPEWPRYGADPSVIAFLAREYRHQYGEIWDEFVALAGGDATAVSAGVDRSFSYSYAARPTAPRRISFGRGSESPGGAPCAVTYRATRLLFRRDVIEPLADDDRFRVETPDGAFEFTKADFRRVFANVVASASYRERGVYHYATTPAKAGPFKTQGVSARERGPASSSS